MKALISLCVGLRQGDEPRFADVHMHRTLDANVITALPSSPTAFADLTNLQSLVLSNNLLAALPYGLLNFCRSLTNLYASPLEAIDAFGPLSGNAACRNLGVNRLTTIPSTALAALSQLTYMSVPGSLAHRAVKQPNWLPQKHWDEFTTDHRTGRLPGPIALAVVVHGHQPTIVVDPGWAFRPLHVPRTLVRQPSVRLSDPTCLSTIRMHRAFHACPMLMRLPYGIFRNQSMLTDIR